MASAKPLSATGKDERTLLQSSSVYREFLAEREEILKHKWLESEKAGKDIGFERALLDWIRNHRDLWKADRRPTMSNGMLTRPIRGMSPVEATSRTAQ